MELQTLVNFAAIGGFCLALYNCLLELICRKPRAKVRVWKMTREDGIDIGFSAAAVNTGVSAFTVRFVNAVYKDGSVKRLDAWCGSDKLPKVVHSGEQCEIKYLSVNHDDTTATDGVIRVVFVISTGQKFRSKNLPGGFSLRDER